MDPAVYERLDSTADSPAELFEHFEERTVGGHTHHVLTDARHGVERGTVVVEGADADAGGEAAGAADARPDAGDHAIVRGYPSIPRVLVLDPGLSAVFDGRVAVEEKLDGFNVRVADVGEPLAFTRSGYVCPYTTGRARDRLDLAAFFADHPEKLLCAELVGPETPYTQHDYEGVDSHAFRVFDVRDRASGAPLPVADRRDLCEAYGFPQPRAFGWYDLGDDASDTGPPDGGSADETATGGTSADGTPDAVVEDVRDTIESLDAAGREGVVFKSADARTMAKYTTECQHHDDLAHAFALPFDHGRDFLFSRVMRDAFQAAEFDEDDDRRRERAHDLGESVLLPMVEAIRDVEAGEPVGRRHTVRGDAADIEALLAHLRDQSVTVDVVRDERADGQRVVEFLKRSESTRDRIEYFLDGGTYDQ
ncbi:MAG: RNA ligase [Haloarculaceae archaeon]